MNRLSLFLILIGLAAVTAGCETPGGASYGGGIVIGSGGGRSVPPPPSRPPAASKGLDQAARNHIRSAYRFMEKGMPDKARRELLKAERKASRTFWYNYYLGGIYYQKGMYEDANRSWDLAFQYSEGDLSLRTRIRTSQAFAYFQIGQTEQSRNSLELALKIDSGNQTAHALLRDFDTVDKQDKPGKGSSGKGKNKNKGRGKGKKVSQNSEFNSYFFVEMP
jgi:tetratricopeptide (TPR) repeat protein